MINSTKYIYATENIIIKMDNKETEVNKVADDDNDKPQQQRQTQPDHNYDAANSDSVKDIILSKLNELRNNYNFAMNYSLGIINILKYFNGLLCDRVFTSLYESKNYVKFFKELSSLYSSIAEQMKKQTSYVKDQTATPKIMDDCLKQMIENTQIALCNKYLSLSNSLKDRILVEGLITNMESCYTKLENIKKEIMKRVSKIENRRKKLEKLYKSKYEVLFEELVSSDTSSDQNRLAMFEDITDFIVVDLELGTKVNKMYQKTNAFLTDLKDLAKNMNSLFINYSSSLRSALMIYVQECKKIYTNDMSNVFEQAEIYCEGMSKPEIDQSFQIHKIFALPEDVDIINEHLKMYQHLLKCLQRDNTNNNSELNNESNFEIQSYSNVEEFYELLIKINPKGDIGLNCEVLINDTFKVKRDPGMFKGWKDAVLLLSKQNHVIVYDEPISYKTFVVSLDISKVVCKAKSDKKNANLIEITQSKGKKINFGGYVYDAISKENVTNIMERINEYKKRFEQGGEKKEGTAAKDSEKKNKVLNLFKKKEKNEEKEGEKEKE